MAFDTPTKRRAVTSLLPVADGSIGPLDRQLILPLLVREYVYDNRLLRAATGDTAAPAKTARAGSLTRCGWTQDSIGTNTLLKAARE